MKMDDLISREAAIDVASGYCHPANIAKELAKLPSAQPEIILCKDCKHYGESLPDVDTRMICHKTALNYKPDDFCSYAERREDVDVKP